MTFIFLDSSALIKRYIVEAGTPWIRSHTTGHANRNILIAHITQAEIVSGAMRRKREGIINGRTARAIRLLVDRHASRDYNVVGLTAQILHRAEDLLDTYPLRAYDSIQLASALESNMRLVAVGMPVIMFVSADIRLLTAAAAEGLITANPNEHA